MSLGQFATPISVVLVDDDPDMRDLMTRILVDGGCSVVAAGDGEAALDLIRANPLPDIVVTDLMMPVMSGMELIRRLRAEPPTAELPIVVVSGNANAQEGDEVSGLASAMMDKFSISESLLPTVRAVRRPRVPAG